MYFIRKNGGNPDDDVINKRKRKKRAYHSLRTEFSFYIAIYYPESITSLNLNSMFETKGHKKHSISLVIENDEECIDISRYCTGM